MDASSMTGTGMPPGLARIDPPERPGAARAFAVIENGQRIGEVVLVLTKRPHGATVRRDWWASAPADDPRPLPRPFDTRSAAVTALRYGHATLHQPQSAEPTDTTLNTVRAAYAYANAAPPPASGSQPA